MIESDVVRILVGTSVLAFAAVTDLRWRRAPDLCWVAVAGTGVGLLVWDALTIDDFWTAAAPYFAASGLVLVLAIGGYLVGLIAGGADAKALASFAILGALPLQAGWTVPLGSPFPLVLTMLTNALLVALALPVLLTVLNLARGDVDGLRTFVSLRADVDQVDERVLWPLEYIDADGARHKALTPRGVPLDAFDPALLREHGVERVWVTPKVPFLVPLWGGLVAAVLVGDPIAAALQALLA